MSQSTTHPKPVSTPGDESGAGRAHWLLMSEVALLLVLGGGFIPPGSQRSECIMQMLLPGVAIRLTCLNEMDEAVRLVAGVELLLVLLNPINGNV